MPLLLHSCREILNDFMLQSCSTLSTANIISSSVHAFCWASLVAEMAEIACNAGDLGSTSRLGRSPAQGNGNPLQYSCLEDFMDREALQATVSRWGSQKVGHNCMTNTFHAFWEKVQT